MIGDDLPWAGTFAPNLTMQRQPIAALAEHAVRILHTRVQTGPAAAPEKVVLSAERIVRESNAPPADATASKPNPLGLDRQN